jgi:hypothetical protein
MRLHILSALTAVAACAVLTAAAPAMANCTGDAIRPDLGDQWKDASGKLRWPNEDWSAGLNVTILLMPGTLIDHFGCDSGNRFHPQGTSFSARALPYDCTREPYRSYRVLRPVPVKSAQTPKWFGQRGGAIQYRTTVSAAELLADGTLEPVEAARPSCS